jgi:DNA-binding MurR/RpiR family transcriptional regulator
VNEFIENNYAHLSTKQKLIADYMKNNETEVCFNSLKDISEKVGVTEVTVINFCKSLGFNSFSDLKQSYQDQIKRKISPTQKLFESINKETMKNELFVKAIDQQIKNHQYSITGLSEKKLEDAVHLITTLKKVYILCTGLSFILGEYFKSRLEYLGVSVELLELSNIKTQLLIKALHFTREELYIAITFPEYSKTVVKFVEYIKKKGYHIIGLTDKKSSPLTQFSDITFYSKTDSLIFYNSIQSAISIIEILTTISYTYCTDELNTIKNGVEELENELNTMNDIQ